MNSKDDMSNNLRYIIWDFFIYNRLLIYYVIDINLHWFYNFTCSSLQIDSANRYFEKEPKLHHYVQLAKHFAEAAKHVVQVAREFSYQLVATPALKKDVIVGFTCWNMWVPWMYPQGLGWHWIQGNFFFEKVIFE